MEINSRRINVPARYQEPDSDGNYVSIRVYIYIYIYEFSVEYIVRLHFFFSYMPHEDEEEVIKKNKERTIKPGVLPRGPACKYLQ